MIKTLEAPSFIGLVESVRKISRSSKTYYKVMVTGGAKHRAFFDFTNYEDLEEVNINDYVKITFCFKANTNKKGQCFNNLKGVSIKKLN